MTREEAIKCIKAAQPFGVEFTEALETLIPELKESEDERIRIIILDQMKHWHQEAIKEDSKIDVEVSGKCIYWLKKQDAQAVKEALRTEYEKGRADAITEMQNPARSDEMKNNIIHCQESLNHYYRSGMITIDEYNSAKNLLNSLITNTWKPSYKQMTILEGMVKYASKISAYWSETLQSLYYELKKLQERRII